MESHRELVGWRDTDGWVWLRATESGVLWGATSANGPIRVLLVLVSIKIKTRFIIKCQLLYGLIVLH